MGNRITYLKFINYSSLILWDVKSQLKNKQNYKYPVSSLDNFLQRSVMEWVKIEDNKSYSILGVHSHGRGVYINRVAKGRELTMKKYQKSKVFHLFYCKVRTVKGQWGIVYPEYENSYGSSNMEYLEVDCDKIKPEYLELILKVKRITDEWDINAIGADGRHYPLKTLLSLQIPLPSLKMQNQLVESYQKKIKFAEEQRQKAIKLEQEIEKYLFEELGIEENENENKDKGLKFISFKSLSRWDIPYLCGKIPDFQTKYPQVMLSTVINFFNKDDNRDSIRINTTDFPIDDFSFIGMEQIEKETGNLLEILSVKGKDIKSQTIRVPREFILYGKLRPYLNKYWVNNTNLKNVICSSEFFVFDILPSINKYFFIQILSSKYIQYQIADKSSGARMPRINEEIFLNLRIPLPPKEVQDSIANKINKYKEEIADLKNQAELLKTEAIKEFENEIFSN